MCVCISANEYLSLCMYLFIYMSIVSIGKYCRYLRLRFIFGIALHKWKKKRVLQSGVSGGHMLRRWSDRRNFITTNISFLCLCVMERSPVARRRIFQPRQSLSRSTLPFPGTWYQPPFWVWDYMGRWMGALQVTTPNTIMNTGYLIFINMKMM